MDPRADRGYSDRARMIRKHARSPIQTHPDKEAIAAAVVVAIVFWFGVYLLAHLLG